MSADLDSIAAEEAEGRNQKQKAKDSSQQNAVEDDGYEKSADGENGSPKQKSIQWRRNVDFTPNQNGVIKHSKSAIVTGSRELLYNRNSVDRALYIKGILRNTHTTAPPLPTPEMRSQANSCLPSQEPHSRTGHESSNGTVTHRLEREKNFELAVKDLDYIKMKCLGTDTRRSRTAPVTSVARNLGGISGDQSYARSLLRSQPSDNVLLFQNRPSPMKPLRAWKGFGGNIYFAPLTISQVNSANGVIDTVSRSQTGSAQLISKKNQIDKPQTSSMLLHCEMPQKPAIVMDKDVVMRKSNKDMQEELEWIRSMENVGSLRIETGPGDSRSKEKKVDRKATVFKGSNVHNSSPRQTNTVFTSRQTRPQKSNRPKKNSLKISGDRYETQTASNPVLMATTQYSWSQHRPRSNSKVGAHHREVEEAGAEAKTYEITSCYRNTHRNKNLPSLKHLQDMKSAGKFNAPVKA
ncbi:hypothetical protein EB796_006574 [Bugula neritina]|uniref:Uncharacterized protein n=1 Tax=Bugula neritina TaxID=10212 RepID=A0A7J7KBY5_BUGNE|nr:hypothetical protein EB796_006574 [Bugula neritina]